MMESSNIEQRHVEAGATNLRTAAAAASIMRPKPASPAVAANNTTTIINSSNSSSQHRHHHHDEATIQKASSPTKPNNNACWGILRGVSWLDVYYIATWGIFGAVLRIYLARLFGLDCETAESGDVWHASNVCITATGQTSRKGGAMFIDLPANVLGCLFMGLLSASADHPLPWFPAHHHLQRHASWHKGLTIGFCGCLTTFASWNTQMVVMLDGTQTENGSQIVSALAGYAIGILAALAAFEAGRMVANKWRNPTNAKQQIHANIPGLGTPTFDEDDEEQPSQHGRNPAKEQEQQQQVPNNCILLSDDAEEPSVPESLTGSSAHKRNRNTLASTGNEEQMEFSQSEHHDGDLIGLESDDDGDDDETEAPVMMHMGGSVLSFTTLSLAVLMILGFVYGDVSSSGDYFFYRRMWMTCFSTPLGALLRHQLKQVLPTGVHIQWGTWTANVVGAMLSVLLEALTIQYLADADDTSYVSCLVWALRVGFVGSLSTVSTFVKELVSLERLLDRHLYGILTLLISMSVGLAIYSPIVRS